MKIAIPKERRPDECRVAGSPETVKKLIGLGAEVVVEQGAGQAAEAVTQYQQVLAAAPDMAAAANNLGWILACHPEPSLRNPAKARQLAEFACRKTDYQEPAYLDTLAVAAAASGDGSAMLSHEAPVPVEHDIPELPEGASFAQGIVLAEDVSVVNEVQQAMARPLRVRPSPAVPPPHIALHRQRLEIRPACRRP